MRVLVVCEGKHEESGALEGLLKRLGGDGVYFQFDRVSSNKVHAVHGKGKGYFKRALGWLKEAEKRGVDALILLIDEDGKKERKEEFRDAQNSSLSQLPRAMGVAIKTFDAWMLADEKTLSKILGCTVDTQPNPENIPNPKQVCARLLANSPMQLSQSEMYASVASVVDIDTLCERCQSGFKPFAGYVRNIFHRES